MKLSREAKTGIIVLAGILAFIFGLNYLKSSPLFDNSKTFYAVYKNVGGLQPGTQVSINGLDVGNVKSIQFKDHSGQLLVTFSVKSNFEFSKNSIVELYDTGIIGGKGLQIHPVFDGAPKAQSGDTLKADIKPGLTALLQQNLSPLQTKIEGAVSQADSLLTNVNDVLDEPIKKDLKATIGDLHDLVTAFKSSAEKIDHLLEDNKTRLDHSLKNINRITTNFATLSDDLADAGLGQTLSYLQNTAKQLNTLVAAIEKGEGTLGKLTSDHALYDNLTEAARELDLLLQDVRLNPKRYVNVSVFGKKQKKYTLPEEDPAEQKPE